MTLEEFRILIAKESCYPIYFTDEGRVDVFIDGRSVGYIHLVKEGTSEWWGKAPLAVVDAIHTFAATPIAERDYEDELIEYLEEYMEEDEV